MKSSAQAGFTFCFELLNPQREVYDAWVQHNLMPIEGLNYMIAAGIAGGPQILTWYVGVYEANYSPRPDDVAATFPTSSGESTAYSAATRVPLVLGSVAQGAVDNLASRAEFPFTASKTIRGAFVIASPAKQSTSGPLLSAAQFPSPKTPGVGDVLRVTAGFDLISL